VLERPDAGLELLEGEEGFGVSGRSRSGDLALEVGLIPALTSGMRPLRALLFVSVFAAPALARADDAGATGAHPVAAVPHATKLGTEAAPPPPRAREPVKDRAPKTRERWYGWQSLSTDAASLLLLVVGSAVSDSRGDADEILTAGAVAGYLLGGPATHFMHENPGSGLVSFALRAGLPIGFGYVGTTLEKCPPEADFCGIAGAILGGILGIATAITIDAAALGYDEVPVEPRAGLQSIGIALGHEQATLVASGIF
jgi:hypothetical protein